MKSPTAVRKLMSTVGIAAAMAALSPAANATIGILFLDGQDNTLLGYSTAGPPVNNNLKVFGNINGWVIETTINGSTNNPVNYGVGIGFRAYYDPTNAVNGAAVFEGSNFLPSLIGAGGATNNFSGVLKIRFFDDAFAVAPGQNLLLNNTLSVTSQGQLDYNTLVNAGPQSGAPAIASIYSRFNDLCNSAFPTAACPVNAPTGNSILGFGPAVGPTMFIEGGVDLVLPTATFAADGLCEVSQGGAGPGPQPGPCNNTTNVYVSDSSTIASVLGGNGSPAGSPGSSTTPGYGSTFDFFGTFTITASNRIPEPGSLALMGLALLGAAAVRRRTK